MSKFLLLLLFVTPFSILAQELDEIPRVTTTGTATVYAAPNEVLLNFSIFSSDDDITIARKKNQDISKKVIAYLKGEGIPDKHIQTQYMRVGKRFRRSHTPESGYYEATQQFDVCLDRLDKFEEVVMGLLLQGVENVGNPQFRTTELKTHKDEARKKAVIAAREKAELLAKELGQSIGKAIEIQEGAPQYRGSSQNAYADHGTAGSGAEQEEVGFAPGQLQIRADVRVSFELR